MGAVRGNDIALGEIAGTGAPLPFPRTMRDKHLYVCGATGTGKSKFLEHLIRQDIRNWPKSKCGMLVLDPHGSLYDSVMRWLARTGADGLLHFPIIPIDLRQDDWIVSYNAIRKRKVSDSSVIVNNFVQAMAHVWGESGTDQTPRFARWVTNVLQTLYENGLTLLEAEYLIDHLDKLARHKLGEKLEDRASRRDWQFANGLNSRDFENALGSTVNRLHRFLRNKRMRSVFGNSRVSLDLGRALEEGHIILVSLATAGAKVYQSGGMALRSGRMREDFRAHPFRVLLIFKTAERRNNALERLLRNTPPILTQVWATILSEALQSPIENIWIRPKNHVSARIVKVASLITKAALFARLAKTAVPAISPPNPIGAQRS